MCTYLTEQIKVTGSGKGADGWFGLTDASVYFDHPVHAPAEHSLNIDFLNPGPGPVGPGRGGADARSPRAPSPRPSRPPWRRSPPTCSESALRALPASPPEPQRPPDGSR